MSDTGFVAVRWALYVDLGLLFGLPLFALYAVGGGRTGHRCLSGAALIAGLSVLGLLLCVPGFGLQASAMAGLPLGQPDRQLLSELIGGTPLGIALKMRLAALLFLLILATLHRRAARATTALATLAASLALGTLAWSGHGAAGEGSAGWIQLAADLVHLLAAGAWVGALAAFLILVLRKAPADEFKRVWLAERALRGFGSVGTPLVGLIVATGAINGLFLVGLGHRATLGQSSYGLLLIAKLLLFAAMLGLASLNRCRLTPTLGLAVQQRDAGRAMTLLRRGLLVEGGLALVSLGLVAWLGTLSPPMPE